MDNFNVLFSCFRCPHPGGTSQVVINGVKFSILKLLGEGGFSYVYLVQSKNGDRYALKKIRCTFGSESIEIALSEVAAYKEFQSPYIIKSIDSSIVSESDGSKSVYILLPYFANGTLQDMITNNVISNNRINEEEVIRLFIGICRGVQVMHRHRIITKNIDFSHSSTLGVDSGASASTNGRSEFDASEADFLLDDTDGESIYPLENLGSDSQDLVPFAHRDLKPANVMISADGLPVLGDLGSCCKARVDIETRQQAIALLDHAAEFSTLPYRAPELLDVETGSKISEKTDIWSLGCILYAMMYGSSPFERAEIESGASISLAISSGKYDFPNEGDYSEELKAMVEYCVVVDPEKRPAIEDVLQKAIELSSRS